MKIAVSTAEPIMVIDKSRKPWEMNGNKGVVYKAICHKKVEDEAQVEEVRITEEVYNKIEPMHRYHFDATIDVKNSRMEVTRAFPVPDGNTGRSTPAPDGNTGKSTPAPGKPTAPPK